MSRHRRRAAFPVLSLGLVALGCSPAAIRGTDPGPAPAPRLDAGAGTPDVIPPPPDVQIGPPVTPPADAAAPKPDLGPSGPVPTPADFTKVEAGGFKLGGLLGAENPSTPDGQTNCNFLMGVVRDFKGRLEPGGHPDFETFWGNSETKGLVGATLGPDRKPVYASRCERIATAGAACPFGAQTTSQMRFEEWFRKADGVNQSFLLYFSFDKSPTGLLTFDSQTFFPLDGAGFGNSGNDEMLRRRNFHFTTELHAKFKYNGGEKFTFSGDDDLWVYINGKLAIDLGGLHKAVTETIDLDASAAMLGIEKGKEYPIELFHAERRTDGSHFKVETNFTFVNCGQVID